MLAPSAFLSDCF